LYDNTDIWGRSTEEGLPIAKEALGNLICEVSHSLDLGRVGTNGDGTEVEAQSGSELFICKVVRVEMGSGESGREDGEPLLYLRHKFVKPGQEILEEGC
jgi:flavin reductase (DIM6/NTAB) family NADH-FMN oxidoreductase RutF